MDYIHYGAYTITASELGCDVYHMGEHIRWYPSVLAAEAEIDQWNNAK